MVRRDFVTCFWSFKVICVSYKVRDFILGCALESYKELKKHRLFRFHPSILFNCWVVSDSFATPWTIVRQAPPSTGFPRQGYWSALLFPSPPPPYANSELWGGRCCLCGIPVFCLFIFCIWLCWCFIAALGFSLFPVSRAGGSYSLSQCTGFSLQWLLLLQSTGFRGCGLQSLRLAGLVTPSLVESSQIRDWSNPCPLHWQVILNHWTTREVLTYFLKCALSRLWCNWFLPFGNHVGYPVCSLGPGSASFLCSRMLTPSGSLDLISGTGEQEAGRWCRRAYLLLTPLWHLLGLAVACVEDTALLPVAVFHTVFHVLIITRSPCLLGPWAGSLGLWAAQRECTVPYGVPTPCPASCKC